MALKCNKHPGKKILILRWEFLKGGSNITAVTQSRLPTTWMWRFFLFVPAVDSDVAHSFAWPSSCEAGG